MRFARSTNHARWAKNGASSSNPKSLRHRENVMSRYAAKTEQEDKLTKSALDQLSSLSFGDDSKTAPMETEFDFDAKTIDTTFSAFSVASCASFRGIESHWSRIVDDPVAKEICSLASMLTDLTNQNEDIESEQCRDPADQQANADDPLQRVKQFGALVVFISNNETQESTLTAAYYLLSLIIGKVNPQILRNQFADVIPYVRSHLTQYFKSSNVLMLKSALTCFAEFICRQPMKTLLDLKVDAELLMSFIHHDFAKVRKTCFRLVNLIFHNSDVVTQNVCKPSQHPFVVVISKNLHESLLDDTKPMSMKMRMLNLLQVVIVHNADDLFKVSLETCLSLCSGTDLLLKKKAFQLVSLVFKDESNECIVDPKLNGQLLSALEELKPSFFDQDLVSCWLSVYESVLINLSKLSPQLFSSHFISFLSFGVTTVFVSQIKATVSQYVKILCGIFDNLPNSIRDIWFESKHDKLSDVSKLSEIVSELTNFKYSDNFLAVFTFIGKVYSALGADFYPLFEPSVINLCTLKTNNSEFYGLPIVLNKAIGSFGPDKILQSYPLNIRGEPGEDLMRSWMIPLLRAGVVNSRLSIWQSHFYPIAKNAEKNMEGLFKEPSQQKVLAVLRSQIWGLLPTFCLNCQDAKESFSPGFAKHLSMLISENHACTSEILDAIAAMLKSTNFETVETMIKYAKNYMPQFFNLYLKEKTSIQHRKTVLRILELFFGKIDKAQFTSYFENTVHRVLATETNIETKKLLVDLIREMVSFLEDGQLQNLFTSLMPDLLKHDELNKKVILILKKYLNSISDDPSEEKSTSCVHLIKNFMPNLMHTFDSGSNSARKQVLKCFLQLIGQKKNFDLVHVNEILPRAVMAMKLERGPVKEVSVKLFKASCKRYVDESKLQISEAVERLASTLLKDLEPTCSDQTIASLIALKYLVALYSENMVVDLYKKLFFLLSDYIKNANRPVFFEPAFQLLKVLISVIDSPNLYQFCEKIVTELNDWNEKTKLKYRFSVKIVIFRLAKKVGADVIYTMCPENMKKLAASVRKQINREEVKRKSGESRASDDQSELTADDDAASANTRVSKAETIADILRELESSDDEVQTKESMMTRKTNRSKRSVFINEGKDGIVDLAEKNFSKHLTSKAPTKGEVKRNSKSTELKFAPDGRLLLVGDDGKLMGVNGKKTKLPGITDDDEDDEIDPDDLKGRQIGIQSDTSDSEDDEEGVSAKKRRKKAMSVASSNQSWKTARSKKSEKGKRSNVPFETGKTFKAKNARGDVNVRGKPQPYAFVPLDAQVLNKRKAKKVEGRLKGLVKSSKKGAGKGLKSRVRSSKN